MNLAGVAALISGGASGLGEASARVLAAAGATVVLADLDAAKGNALADELGGAFVHTDVTDEGAVQAAVGVAVDTDKPLRVALSCAGVGWARRIVGSDGTPHDLDMFRTVFEVNVIGTFNVMRFAAAAISATQPLDDEERGVLVNTSSVAAFEGQIGQVAYSASKGAVVAMTLPAARDLGPAGIRVCTVVPGMFDTPLLGTIPEQHRDALTEDLVFPRRLGMPAEFARLVQSICENPYLNGEVIRLDAGMRMRP